MTPLDAISKRPTLDPEAKQAFLTAVKEAQAGASYSGHMLKQAQKANADFAVSQSNIALGRRAVATREAYRGAMNAELARQRAAFLLLAEEAGNKAALSRTTLARVVDGQQQRVLVEKVGVFESRRATLLQAAGATAKALESIPPLPPALAAGAPFKQTNEVSATFNAPGWRPKLFDERAGLFFPRDVRHAAGSLGDGNLTPIPTGTTPTPASSWSDAITRAIAYGAAVVGQAAQTEGAKASQGDPTAAGAYQTVGDILDTIGRTLGVNLSAGMQGTPPGALEERSSPGLSGYILPIAGGLALLGVVVLLRR